MLALLGLAQNDPTQAMMHTHAGTAVHTSLHSCLSVQDDLTTFVFSIRNRELKLIQNKFNLLHLETRCITKSPTHYTFKKKTSAHTINIVEKSKAGVSIRASRRFQRMYRGTNRNTKIQ